MKEQELTELSHKIDKIFEELVDEFELDYGNSGYSSLNFDGTYKAWIEVPNHTVLEIDIDPYGDFDYYTKEEIKDILLDAILETIKKFNPEERFKQVWEIPSFQFLEMLKEDKEYFHIIEEKIRNS